MEQAISKSNLFSPGKRLSKVKQSEKATSSSKSESRAKGNIRMRVARIESGLSQEQLAKQVGATRQTIGLIESGNYNPSLKLCLGICHVLGKTLDDLFWEK